MHHRFIAQLIDASALIEQEATLEGGLKELARLSAETLGAKRCSVMLLAEGEGGADSELRVCSHYGDLPRAAYEKGIPLNKSIAGHVASTSKPLLIEDINQSGFTAFASKGEAANPSLILAPIPVADRTIGVINISEPLDGRRFGPTDLNLLNVLALFVGKSIHTFQLQKLAESRVLQMAKALEQRENAKDSNQVISPNPAKLAKIVAKSFFRELSSAGFGPNAIIAVASEVLSQLNESLSKHRSRMQRNDAEQHDG